MTGKLLDVLLHSFPGGIAIYDAELRLVVSNEAFARLLNLPAEFFAAEEVTMEDFFRFNAERGEYGPGDPDLHVA
ncbi:MAG: PAS-domain containing protein, partial [Hyphomicrobiaceae bacterium]